MPHAGRSLHENKFDRQMRLWGSHGQHSLENSHVLVVGAGPVGTEVLKNLVLPNIGKFTLADPFHVTEQDLGNNFFLEASQLGQFRAEASTALLLEMNPNCTGNALICSAKQLSEENDEFFEKFDCIVLCQVPQSMSIKLLQRVWHCNIPVIVLQAFGLTGYVRLCLDEHRVIESHSESDRTDLFIHPSQLQHFPELSSFLHSFDLSTTDSHIHGHIPYLAILTQALKAYSEKHGGFPETFKEQCAFKDQIRAMSQDLATEENFAEAVKFSHYVFRDPSLRIDNDVKAVLAHEKAKDIRSDSSPFWVLVAALQLFLDSEGHGHLPVSNAIPDMVTDSSTYVKLKGIYASKACEHETMISRHVDSIVAKTSASRPSPEMIALFVANVRTLFVGSYRSLCEELSNDEILQRALREYIDEINMFASEEGAGSDSLAIGSKMAKNAACWYLAIRSAERFHQLNGYYPGDYASSDLSDLTRIGLELCSQLKLNPEYAHAEAMKEMVRCGSSELHTTAAVLGGIGSQIAVKVLTGQYVPLNNTCIWDGCHSILTKLQL